jgi:hypothetical protein
MSAVRSGAHRTEVLFTSDLAGRRHTDRRRPILSLRARVVLGAISCESSRTPDRLAAGVVR